MERRGRLRQLRAFADIREAQKRASDSRLAEAMASLGRQEDRLAAERDRQAARSDAWAASVTGGRLDLQVAWAHALHEGEAAVVRAGRAVQRAKDRREDARAESRAAEARREAAATLVREAERRARRQAEEAAIAEAEDAFGRRRAR